MSDSSQIEIDLDQANKFPYYARTLMMVYRPGILKARLIINPETFVHLNDFYNSTSFNLISQGQRLYARDQVRGKWHRHQKDDPNIHNHSPEGQLSVSLNHFLIEADEILKRIGLI